MMKILALLIFTVLALTHADKGKRAIRFCAQKGLEMGKCRAWSTAVGKDKLECVVGEDSHHCYHIIAKKRADLGIFDGGDIYEAGLVAGLKPIMAETFSFSPDEVSVYYAVAVVKSDSNLTLGNLYGARSCHTGIGRTAGWNAPMGYLIGTKRMPLVDCNLFKSAADFFGGSCAPGANSQKYNPTMSGSRKLCQNCIGDGKGRSICDRSSRELYSGYRGAFKCMRDGAGDVAFIKHSIPLQPSVDQSKFKLLCKDNTRKPPSEYKSCNILKAPSHAIMTSRDKSAAEIQEYQAFLTHSSNKYGRPKDGGFRLFGDGQLFGYSTLRLSPLPPDQQSYDSYLDPAYIEMIQGLHPSCEENQEG